MAEVPEGFAPREVARVVKPAREVVANETFTFSFEPLEDSHGKQYRLDIQAPGVRAGQGIALWAGRGQTYLGGVLAVNGKEQWGDLVFAAHADRASVFRRVEHLLRDKPAWLRSRWTLGTLIVLYNWALAAFTWYMVFVDDENGGVRRVVLTRLLAFLLVLAALIGFWWWRSGQGASSRDSDRRDDRCRRCIFATPVAHHES